MPLHLEDKDVMPEVAEFESVLIVPCNMCPAVTAAVDDGEPFIRLSRHLLRSAPFERHIRELQARLTERGVRSEVFRSPLPHQWFLCMCPSGRREKLRQRAARHDAAIVLGCETAVETVRDALRSTECRVIEGMTVTGFLNARLTFRLPCTISFDDCKLVPLSVDDAVLPTNDASLPTNDAALPTNRAEHAPARP